MFNGFTGHLIMPDMHWDSLTSHSNMFYITRGGLLDIPNWSFGQLKSTYYMFYGGYMSVNAQNWDVDGVLSLSNMFRQYNGEFVDISGMHSTTVNTVSQMFEYAGSIKKIILSDCNFPVLTSMYSMFYNDGNLEWIIGLDTWNVQLVTDMGSLFTHCVKLNNVAVANWDTSHVTNMNALFHNCITMTEIDISGWDLSSVTNNSDMFNISSAYIDNSYDYSGLNIKSIILGPKFKFTSGTYFPHNTAAMSDSWEREDAVYGPFLYTEIGNQWTPEMAGKWIWGAPVYALCHNTEKDLVFFRSRDGLKSINNVCRLVDLDGQEHIVTASDYIFRQVESCTVMPWNDKQWLRNEIESVYATGLGGRLIKPKTCKDWFRAAGVGYSKLTSCDLSQFDMSECESWYGMFEYCEALSDLRLGNWSVTNVTDMSYMFYDCSALSEIDVSNFDTSKVTTMD